MKTRLQDFYKGAVLDKPYVVLFIIAFLGLALTQSIGNFRLDASSDSLVLENDTSLQYYQEVVSQYGNSDYLVLSYSPKADLFSDEALADLSILRDSLLALDEVDSITSIVDVPLMQSPPLTLSEVNTSPIFLQSEGANRELAKQEFNNSPLYRDLLVSEDLATTALIVQLKSDPELSAAYRQRNTLRNQSKTQQFTSAERDQLKSVSMDYQTRLIGFQHRQTVLIGEVRQIMQSHQAQAFLFLGGVPMIASDSISYIKNDLIVFGAAALLVIVLILSIAFRQTTWVLVPLIVCAVTGYLMMCLLGLMNWPVSVVSSNFLSLLLIITLSLNIHLIVRYREIYAVTPTKSKQSLLAETMSSKFIPCLYTALTTIVAFASLLVSGIRPVIDFGWMMCIGIVVAMVVTFTVFPALLAVFKPSVKIRAGEGNTKVLDFFARSIDAKAASIIIGFMLVSAFGIYGVTRLTVENRFIDYFKASTEIYQGMHLIDAKLGGTTPLDIILDAPKPLQSAISEEPTLEERGSKISEASTNVGDGTDFEEDDYDDDFDDFDEDSFDTDQTLPGYWFKAENLARLDKIHKALDAIPETGKVISLATAISAFNQLKDAKPMDDIDLAFMYQVLSDENKQRLITPYMSADGEQVRLNVRVFESDKNLDRNQLIADVQTMLTQGFGLLESQVHLSGMLVLYNNMLNSLFNSQIMTLGLVFLAIFVMFIVLFRNLKMAMVAIVPNLFAATFVLGLMGVLGIPLDLMTITIAAISVGIAVDDTIHYVHRFTDEYHVTQDYSKALHNSATSIGKAMYYTTLVITVGFMILVFSNFVPTVYFGMLTGVAMVSALVGDLVLLPVLIKKVRPL